MQKPDTTELASLIATHAPYDGVFELRIPGVSVIKFSRPTTTPTHALQRSSACIVAGGAKSVMIGEDVFEYGRGQVAVYSIDLPVATQITEASISEPYLTLRVNLDPVRITELAAKVFPHGAPQPKDPRALYIGAADADIVDAATRLMRLMGRPAEAELIAPLVIDELLIRLLRSPMGSRIAQMGQADSSLHRIAKAVAWLRENYDQPVDVDELAKLVNMSISTFHKQFKAVASMSPLQVQKALRLQEAAVDAHSESRYRRRRPARRLCQRVAVHARIRALLRNAARERHSTTAGAGSGCSGDLRRLVLNQRCS